jgi:hypothetical protein
LYERSRASSLTIVDFKLLKEPAMIRPTSKYLVLAAMISFAAYGNAGTAAISPSFAACSKALVESIAKSEKLPPYSVKEPAATVSSLTDPDSYTVLAHKKSTRTLVGKASCTATPDGEIVSFKSLPVKS